VVSTAEVDEVLWRVHSPGMARGSSIPEPTVTQEPGAEPLVDVVIQALNEAHVLAKSVAIVPGFLDNP
jgi:hypothetical protein